MAKVIFTRAFGKNILSIGNAGIEYKLNVHSHTLIIGENGAGKSTLLSIICFALFNRPYVNINKPQLINSINNKELVCEVDFTIGSNDYMVRRGIKPNIFEIWCNNELINQDAANKDYQSILENQIIKFNCNPFIQVAMIGAANYKPFMQLTTPARRAIIEELLDIKIFSDMFEVLKKDKDRVKNELQELETQLTICKSKVKMQNEFIKKYEKDNEIQIVELKNNKNNALESNKNIQDSITPLQEENDQLAADLVETEGINKHLTKLLVYKTKLESSIQGYQKKIEEYKDLTNCPTCTQDICDNHRNELIDGYQKKIDESRTNLILLNDKIKEIEYTISILSDKRNKFDSNAKIINDKTREIFSGTNLINQLDSQIEKLQSINNDSINQAKSDIKKGAEEVLNLIDKNKKLLEEKNIQETAGILLKDQGIKASIIKKILPVLNQLINSYLNKLDFFVSFEFNEQFEETIKSRYRDSFSYNSFSEGQKLRIDMAILFAWRELIKQRSAIDTNILMMDEILDKSIDSEGIALLIDILYSDIMHGTNIFLISHRTEWMDKFSNVISLELKNNFTVIKEK